MTRSHLCAIALTCVLAAVTPGAAAADPTLGTLDPTFASNGALLMQYGDPPNPESALFATAALPGGGVAVAGLESGSGPGGAAQLVVTELDADGSPVAGFAGGTPVTSPLGAIGLSTDTPPFVAVEPGGDVLVAATGTDAGGRDDLVIERYLPDGMLDTTFASNGTFAEQLSSVTGSNQQTKVAGLGFDQNGRVVVSGTIAVSYMDTVTHDVTVTDELFVARFTAAGTPDAAFGTAGVWEQQLGTLGSKIPVSGGGPLIVNSDGGVDIAVDADDSSGMSVWGLLALDSSGEPADGFGDTGVALDDTHSYLTIAPTALVRTPAGDLLLVGNDSTTTGTAPSVVTEAFASGSGAIDASFAVNGLFEGPSNWTIQAAAVQPDGDVDLAGYSGSTSTTGLVAQLTPGGLLNSTFGTQGAADLTFGATTSLLIGATLDASGELIVAGAAAVSPTQDEAVLARVIVHIGPSASVSYSPIGPLVGQTVTLTGSATAGEGSILSQSWDLDGSTATGPTATISYPTPGLRTVTFFATDADGFTASATTTVSVIQLVDTAPVTVTKTSTTLGPVQYTPTTSTGPGTTTIAPGVDTTTTTTTTGTGTTGKSLASKARRPHLLHAKLVASKQGAVTAHLACAKGTGRCSGKLEIVTTGTGKSPKLVLAHGPHLTGHDLLLGSAGYSIAAAHKLGVKLHLPLAGRLLLRRLHELHAELTLTAGSGTGASTTGVAVTVVPATARHRA